MHCFVSFCGRWDFHRIFYLIEKNGSFCIVNTCKMLPLNWIKTIVTQILSAISLSFSLSLELQHVVLMFWCVVCHFKWMRHFIIVATESVFFLLLSFQFSYIPLMNLLLFLLQKALFVQCTHIELVFASHLCHRASGISCKSFWYFCSEVNSWRKTFSQTIIK